jgi:hypothetical protein
MARKIVQLAVAHAPRDQDAPPESHLFALCDDGSVWGFDWGTGEYPETWHRFPNVPQE